MKMTNNLEYNEKFGIELYLEKHIQERHYQFHRQITEKVLLSLVFRLSDNGVIICSHDQQSGQME
jgi:hypothetical protein